MAVCPGNELDDKAARPIRADQHTNRLQGALAELEGNMVQLCESMRRLEATRAASRTGRSSRERLHASAYARLQARLESLPVIEQAKGMIMATKGCDADEAFDVLRRASQRTNVPLRQIAARMVEEASRRRSPATSSEPRKLNGRRLDHFSPSGRRPLPEPPPVPARPPRAARSGPPGRR